MNYRILVYEDNEALRKSFEELLSLSDEFTVAGAYENPLHATDDIRALHPHVILMDIEMPGINGIEAVRRIRNVDKQVIIIMLTVFDDNTHVFDAICAGASGYLLKKHASERLTTAIKDALGGGAPMSPAIAKIVIDSMHRPSSNDYHFTPREKEILQLLCKGNSYKMVAAATGISFETVRTYIKKIYEKLQVHSSTEAVLKAINEKLV